MELVCKLKKHLAVQRNSFNSSNSIILGQREKDAVTTVQRFGLFYLCLYSSEREAHPRKEIKYSFYVVLMSQVELNRQRGSMTGLIWQNSILQNKTETHSHKCNTLAK